LRGDVVRIAVLADVHGNLPALEAVLSHLREQGGSDEVWVLGDLAVFCPYPTEVLERLAALTQAHFVMGNTDRYLVTGQRPRQVPVQDEAQWSRLPAFLEERDANFRWTVSRLSYRWYSFLRELPDEQRLEVPGYGTVVGVHGSPLGDEVGVWAETTDAELRGMLGSADCRMLLCGHTHRPLERGLDGVRIVNVGSVGLPLDGDRRAAYATLEFDDGECQTATHRVEYDVDQVLTRLAEVGHPAIDWVGSRLRLAASPA
jgi:predicted phosphodiesterase